MNQEDIWNTVYQNLSKKLMVEEFCYQRCNEGLYGMLNGLNVFYEFIDDYSEQDGGTKNDIAISKEKPTQKDKIIGVIDGQQRLSALYIGLHGKYKMHIPYRSWYEDSGFAPKELYVNLFGDIGLNDKIIFKFLTDDEAKEKNPISMKLNLQKVNIKVQLLKPIK